MTEDAASVKLYRNQISWIVNKAIDCDRQQE